MERRNLDGYDRRREKLRMENSYSDHNILWIDCMVIIACSKSNCCAFGSLQPIVEFQTMDCL